MQETDEKSVFSRYFNREMTEDEIKSLSDEDIISLFLPSNFHSLHNPNRAMVIESVMTAFIRYYNLKESEDGYYILTRSEVFPPVRDSSKVNCKKRYTYHGGNCGIFDGYFSVSDKYYRIFKQNDKIAEIDSIPNWNISHFFCDYFNTDEKVRDAFKWFIEDYFWNGYGKNAIARAFSKKDK